jgi:tetraacyldisaccharide 4'-kinase
LVLINGNKNNDFENKIFEVNDKIKIFYSYYKPVNLDEFKNKKLLAIAGIGNPENFFKLIENYKLQIEKKLVFPDHHSFSKREIQEIIDRAKKEELHIIMTEKDYFKVNKFKIDKVNYLKVSLEILKKNEFMNIVSKVYD